MDWCWSNKMHVVVPPCCSASGALMWTLTSGVSSVRNSATRALPPKNVFETVGHPHHTTHTPDCREREPCNRAADSYQVAWWRVEARYPLEICFFDESATMTPKARFWWFSWLFMDPLEIGIFSMNLLLWHPKPALARFYDFSWPPLKRASLVNDFTFYSFLRLFSGPISPICCFLRCFYRPHKPEPKKVTKSYVWVTKSYGRVTKSYKKLRLSYQKVTASYEKLWKITNELPNNFL